VIEAIVVFVAIGVLVVAYFRASAWLDRKERELDDER
jgi:hypothetical protein